MVKKDLLFIVIQFTLFACYFILAEPPYIPNLTIWGYILWPLVALGILVIIFGILNLEENLTVFPSPKKKNTLISNGIYKYVRHPIYTGILLIMFSYAFLKMSIILVVISSILWLVLYFKSRLEEEYLVQRHSEYRDYKERTGRFFPKLFT
tara:strand:- start:423 stop:875 length:453 start_codon:yes stop_codon:yes gene_type:complete